MLEIMLRFFYTPYLKSRGISAGGAQHINISQKIHLLDHFFFFFGLGEREFYPINILSLNKNCANPSNCTWKYADITRLSDIFCRNDNFRFPIVFLNITTRSDNNCDDTFGFGVINWLHGEYIGPGPVTLSVYRAQLGIDFDCNGYCRKFQFNKLICPIAFQNFSPVSVACSPCEVWSGFYFNNIL